MYRWRRGWSGRGGRESAALGRVCRRRGAAACMFKGGGVGSSRWMEPTCIGKTGASGCSFDMGTETRGGALGRYRGPHGGRNTKEARGAATCRPCQSAGRQARRTQQATDEARGAQAQAWGGQASQHIQGHAGAKEAARQPGAGAYSTGAAGVDALPAAGAHRRPPHCTRAPAAGCSPSAQLVASACTMASSSAASAASWRDSAARLSRMSSVSSSPAAALATAAGAAET